MLKYFNKPKKHHEVAFKHEGYNAKLIYQEVKLSVDNDRKRKTIRFTPPFDMAV